MSPLANVHVNELLTVGRGYATVPSNDTYTYKYVRVSDLRMLRSIGSVCFFVAYDPAIGYLDYRSLRLPSCFLFLEFARFLGQIHDAGRGLNFNEGDSNFPPRSFCRFILRLFCFPFLAVVIIGSSKNNLEGYIFFLNLLFSKFIDGSLPSILLRDTSQRNSRFKFNWVRDFH